ncbi:MAG TPA: hypothetical protein VGN94_01645 [Methylobacterium sp.]|nr:hypothetical protein [Methylobacterium sp.]
MASTARELGARQGAARRRHGLQDAVGVGAQQSSSERAGELVGVDRGARVRVGQDLADPERKVLDQGILVAEAGHEFDVGGVAAGEVRGHLAQDRVAQVDVQALEAAFELHAEVHAAGQDEQATRPDCAPLLALAEDAADPDGAVEVEDHEVVADGAV